MKRKIRIQQQFSYCLHMAIETNIHIHKDHLFYYIINIFSIDLYIIMDKLLEACKYEQEVLKHNLKTERMRLKACMAANEDLKKEIDELEGKISMIKFIAKLS